MTDHFGAVPAVGQPWPEGRSAAPAHCAPWLVLRHGGRRTDSWKAVNCGDEEEEGRRRFVAVEHWMRRGGVVLVDPAGVVRARAGGCVRDQADDAQGEQAVEKERDVNDACGSRIIGPTIWTDEGRCGVCGYLPRMGNRRTPESKRNWIRYCRTQHEMKHQRPAPPEKEKIDSGRNRQRWERYQSRDVNGLFEPEDEILGGCLAHREEYELAHDFPGMPDPPTTPCVGGCPACGYSMLGIRKTQRDRCAASGVAWANYEHPTFTRAHVEHAQRLARISRGASGPAEVTDRPPRLLDEWADRMVEETRARMGRGGR